MSEEKMIKEFFDMINEAKRVWIGHARDGKSPEDAMDGMIHSILCVIDGASGVDPFDLGRDGVVCNEHIMLHDAWYAHGSQAAPTGQEGGR